MEVGGLSFLEANYTQSWPFAAGYFRFSFIEPLFCRLFLVKFTFLLALGLIGLQCECSSGACP